MAESTRDLMNFRGREIDTFIRYKLVAVTIDNGDFGSSLSQIINDPLVIMFLARAFFFRLAHGLAAALAKRDVRRDDIRF